MVQFAGEWIPAHEAWDKMEVVTTVVETIERFNENHPELATDATRAVVPEVRRRLASIELVMPKKPQKAKELRGKALSLLEHSSPEEAVDQLQDEFSGELNLQTLIAMAGMPAYLGALKREMKVLRENKISPDQAATLWNDIHRVAAGGGSWTGRKVEMLMAGEFDD